MRDNNSNVITVCNDSVLHAPKEHDVDAIYRQVKDLQMKKKIEKKYAMKDVYSTETNPTGSRLCSLKLSINLTSSNY